MSVRSAIWRCGALRTAASRCPPPLLWTGVDGGPIAGVERIRVLDENFRELPQPAQDAFYDALRRLVDALPASFAR